MTSDNAFLPAGYAIEEGLARFDMAKAHHWIGVESYWAKGIPYDRFERAWRHSLALGVYRPDGSMAAIARVVTDRATFGWICDVFVDAAERGHGLGKAIMAHLKAHPDLQGLRRLHLATADAHELYRQFGFTDLTKTDRWMEIRHPDPYGHGQF